MTPERASTMKYGLLVYPETKNLGDDIQSYAALQFLPRVDSYIDREHLSMFRSEGGKPVAVIMNAWYMNNKFNWPPANDIVPLYISMHFNQEDYFGVHTSFLDGLGGRALRECGNVGCRDIETLRVLREKSIPSYFSACLTLTLPRKFKKDAASPYACLVDVSNEIAVHVKELCPDLDVHVLSQEPHPLSTLSWDQRFQLVEEYLTAYQNASFVITTKLHCALPCLALGTPVLLLKNSSLYDLKRFAGLDEFLHVSDSESFLSGKCSWNPTNPPQNSNDYLPYREALIQKCTGFVHECENGKVLPHCTFSAEQRLEWQSALLEQAQKRVNDRFSELYHTLSELQAGKDWLEQHSQEQEQWISELQKGKDWLEQQIQEQEQWISELQKGKEWLEQQIQGQERRINELQKENESLRQVKGWLKYKLHALRRTIQ